MRRPAWVAAAAVALVVAVTVPAAFGWISWPSWTGLDDLGGEADSRDRDAESGPGDGDAESASGDVSTARVRRTTLVDTLEIDGTLGYPEPTDVSGPAGVVTKVPEPGATRKRGQELFRVDDDPVVLLYGSLPAYRTLAEGDHGRDVRALERNLDELGYSGFDVDREYTWYTAEAVREWQDDLGIRETGKVPADRIAYAEGKVRIAEVHHRKGDAVSGEPVLSHDQGEHRVTAELELAEQDLAEVGAEVEVELPSRTTVSGTIEATDTVTTGSGGSSAGSGGSSTGSGSGGSGGGSGETVVELTISPNRSDAPKELDALDTAPVLVTLQSEQRKDVLAVPVSALLARPGGGYAVEVVDAPGAADGTDGDGGGADTSDGNGDTSDTSGNGDGSTSGGDGSNRGNRSVEVELGMFADGLVEVSSPELEPGMHVEVPSR